MPTCVTVTDQLIMGGDVRVFISEPGITAGTGCAQVVGTVSCDIGSTDSVTLDMAGGNDVVTINSTLVRHSVDGDEGEDGLTGSDATEGAFFGVGDSLRGGPDRDTLVGRGGDDQLDGEEGNGDLADGGPGDDSFTFSDRDGGGDVLHGGPGFDGLFVSYFGPDPAPGLAADLAAGTVSAVAATGTFDGIEDLDGDDGPDTLLGSAGPNEIGGDEGEDVIDGRGGPDRLDGEEGNDRLEGRDGFFDQLLGGAGVDTCDADQLDVSTECEGGALLQVAPFGSSPAPDLTAPSCQAQGVPSRVARARLLKRGLLVRAVCDEAGTLAVRLEGTLRRLGRAPPGGPCRRRRAGGRQHAGRGVPAAARAAAGREGRAAPGSPRRSGQARARIERRRRERADADEEGENQVTPTRALVLPITVAALLLPAAPAAAAGTVTRSSADSNVTYTASGVANVVLTDQPQAGGTRVTISEPGILVGMTAVDCQQGVGFVTCDWSATEEGFVSATLGATPDSFDGSALTRSAISVQAQGGADTLRGGNLVFDPEGNSRGDSLNGGAGVDQIFGGDGGDFLTAISEGGELAEAGPGDDEVLTLGGGATADTMRGGPGQDQVWVRASPGVQSFIVDLAAARSTDQAGLDAPDVIEGFEDARTDEGNDVLLGTGAFNVLRSGSGEDRLDAGLGADVLFGEDGADRLEARDGIADRLSAGAGIDSCLTDQLDETSDCEAVEPVSVTPFGAVFPDADPPSCTTPGLAARPRARALARSGIVVRADCDEPGRVSVRLLAALRRVDGRARLARSGDIELAAGTATLDAGGNARVRLRVSRRLRPLLRRNVRLRVVLKAVDATGNRAPRLTRRLRLR